MEKKIYQEPKAKVVELDIDSLLIDNMSNGQDDDDATSKSANDYVPFDEDEDDYIRRRR